MTRKEFINNFDEKSKLETIKKWETMSLEEFIAGPKRESIEKTKSNYSRNIYNEFVDLYKKYEDNTITNIEKERLEFLFSLYAESQKNMIERLKKDIEIFKVNLEYFCEIPNLPFEEWLNTYYVLHLHKIPKELMSDDYKADRMLMVDVFNGKLTFEEYQKIIRNPDDLFYAKRYINIDYNNYLETQITKPTIKAIIN